MKHSTPVQFTFVALLALGTQAAGCASEEPSSTADAVVEAHEATYVVTHRDERRCAWPACGGYFVAEVNASETVCSGGDKAAECYVSSLDWSALELDDDRQNELEVGAGEHRVLLHGELQRGSRGKSSLVIADALQTVDDKPFSLDETFYNVRFNGKVCVVAPCYSYNAVTLNSDDFDTYAGVDLGIGMGNEVVEIVHAGLGSDDGIVLAATPYVYEGPTRPAYQLRVSSALLPVKHGGVDSCPADDDPAVHYASHNPAKCRAILFRCAEGESYFGGDCGCGCIAEQ